MSAIENETLVRNNVVFHLLEKRGGAKLMCSREPSLCYAVFDASGRMLARLSDTVLAAAVLDALEEEALP